MRTHIKILGYFYAALGCAVALFAILGFVLDVIEGKFAQVGIAALVLIVGLWWVQTGAGLLTFRKSARLYAIVVAAVVMLGLNAALLLFGGAPFSTSTAWITFHAICICVGVYTLVVMLVPSGAAIFTEG